MSVTGKVTPSSKWAIAAIIAFGMIAAVELAETGVYTLREIFYWNVPDSGIVSPAGIEDDISRVHRVKIWHTLVYLGSIVVLSIWLRSSRRTLSALRASGAVSTPRWARIQTLFSFFNLMIPLRFFNESEKRDTGGSDDRDNLKIGSVFLLSLSWLVLLIMAAVLYGYSSGRVARVYQKYYLCEFLTIEKAKLLASGVLFWNKWIIVGHLMAMVAASLAIVLIRKNNSRLNQVYMEMTGAGRIIDFSASATDASGSRSRLTPGFFQRAGGVVLVLFGSVVLLGAIGSMVSGTSKASLLSQLFSMTLLGIFPVLGGIFLYLNGSRKRRRSKSEQAGVESPEAGNIKDGSTN